MLETGIIILKFVSIIVACLFGIYGLLNDYKDKENKITKQGKIALMGIIISMFISALAYTFEIYKNKSDTYEAIKRNTEILQEIDRSIQPKIDRLLIWWTFDISLKHKIFNEYILMLNKISNINTMINNESSRINPLNQSNGDVQLFFHRLHGILYFFRTPIRNEILFDLINLDSLLNSTADLKLTFGHWGQEQSYNINSDRNIMEVKGRDISEKVSWIMSGEIISITDIYGSQLLFSPQITKYDSSSKGQLKEQLVQTILKNIQLKYLTIEFPNYRIMLPISEMRRIINDEGIPYYIYTFPDSRQEFIKHDVRHKR